MFGDVLTNIPWEGIAVFLGGGAAGGGLARLLTAWSKHKSSTEKDEATLREELRNDLSNLRDRLEQTEQDHIELREKHFQLQERYHELKREYTGALEKIEHLRQRVENLTTELEKEKNS